MPSNSWQAYTAWCKSCGGEGDLYRGYCPSCWEKWEASNGANHRWRIERCRIGQILFSQATIADTFTDGTPLQDTVDLLSANPRRIEKIPYISVVDDGDRHISMDNRRLYAFRMAFDDNYEVPIKRFASKEDYGAADFHRKATSVCGGHSVELRHHHTVAPHTETLNPPCTAKRFLLQKWKELRSSVGAVLSLQDGQVMISGTQRQVEDGIKHYQRILSTFHCEAVDLKDVRAKDAVRNSFQRWQAESKYSTVDISFDNEWSESGPTWQLLVHLGGDAEEVAEVKALVMDLVNAVARCWEALPLPPHTGGYFSRTLAGKLPGKFAVEDDILHIRGNAAEREKMKNALEDLLSTVLSKQLQVDDGRLRSMIIGKDGVNIKRLRQNTSVDVHVGKDPDTTVRIAGSTADVELVYSRLKAFIQEHRQITKELRLLPHAGRFMWRRLKTIGCEAEAFLRMPREGENLVEIHGNQRQVDHAEELLQGALYLDFSCIKLRISKRLKSDVLLGKNGVHIKDIKGQRDVEIQFEDSTDENSMQDCVVSGQPDDCKSVLDEILRRLSGYEVVSMPVDSRTAGLIIGKGGASIKSLQEGLQIRAETRGTPWVIFGPKHDVREFLLRLQLRFGVATASAGQETWLFVCPGCGLDFPSKELMLAHVRRPGCPARSCIACDCGAVYADEQSCRKHEELCKKVRRCSGCRKAFASQAEVADHVKSEGCNARACSGCNQIFKDPEALQSHQLTCEKYLERQRNQEVRTEIRSLKIALCAQCRLGEQKGSSCPKCKALLRKAKLQWHPDKNPQNEIVATIIFRSVQAVWDGEPQWLADEGRRPASAPKPAHRDPERPRAPAAPAAPAPFPTDCCVQ